MDISNIELALKNISKYGDTDIFPYPIEKIIFYDKINETSQIIEKLDKDFYNSINIYPPVNINTSVPVGYTGFRWATQIDPLWNSYFLASVISIAHSIENLRIPKEQNIIYSYRYSPDINESTLFDKEYNWLKFQKDSLSYINQNGDYKYVVICDIADFYSRIYHHPLENSLERLDNNNDTPKKVKKLIQKFSNTKSYGLPIGGDASRILAELVLNNTDRLLLTNGIKFKRFVDDIHIFCKTIEEAHSNLNFLAMKLMRNEGLSLQKHKTQIQSSIEFQKLVASRINAESEDNSERHRAKFMALPINYDPYSDNAVEDYERIKEQLEEFDIFGLINDELKKVRIHQQFGKRLIKTFDILDSSVVTNSFKSIISRLEILYPIFPTIMQSAYKNLSKLDEETKNLLMDRLRNLVKSNSYIIQSEINMTFLLRVLGLENNILNEEAINSAYHRFSESIMVKCTTIQIMTRWKAYHWLSDKKDGFLTMNKWERRMYIIAANFLGDEGNHWINHNKKEFTEFENLINCWANEKSKIRTWSMPL